MTIKLTGTLSAPLEDGAYFQLTIKVGLIKLLEKTLDLCEEEDIKCPIPAGPVVLTDTWTLQNVPPV